MTATTVMSTGTAILTASPIKTAAAVVVVVMLHLLSVELLVGVPMRPLSECKQHNYRQDYPEHRYADHHLRSVHGDLLCVDNLTQGIGVAGQISFCLESM